MRHCCLSEESLVRLGIYDDTYDLYYNIVQTYHTAYNGYYEVNPESSVLWPQKLDELARKECRRAIDGFLQKHSSVFTSEYSRLYTNATSIKIFSILNVTNPKPLTIKVRIMTFHSFLQELYNLVSQIIFLRMQREKPKISREYVFSQVEKTVADSEQKATESRLSMKQGNFATPETRLIIFQSLSLISCNLQNHVVVPKLYRADSIGNSSKVLLPVHYCKTCDRCFVGEKTLAIYEKMYGKFFVQKDQEKNQGLVNDFFSELNNESLLHSLGYNVVEGKLTERERRECLVYLIKNEKISYFQACRDLENAIRIFRDVKTHQVAVKKWTADLEYISEYIKYGISRPQ